MSASDDVSLHVEIVQPDSFTSHLLVLLCSGMPAVAMQSSDTAGSSVGLRKLFFLHFDHSDEKNTA